MPKSSGVISRVNVELEIDPVVISSASIIMVDDGDGGDPRKY
jgi:hypothetical protein